MAAPGSTIASPRVGERPPPESPIAVFVGADEFAVSRVEALLALMPSLPSDVHGHSRHGASPILQPENAKAAMPVRMEDFSPAFLALPFYRFGSFPA
jgi:hypothetical protein